MLISERIFALMKELHMTQKEFSRQTGIAESTISDWKRKKLNPSADKLAIISKVLGISLDALLDTEKTSDSVIVSLSESETLILERYRMLDDVQKSRILAYAKTLQQSSASNENAISYEQSNTDLSAFPSDQGDYQLESTKRLVKRLRKLARLDRIRLDESQHQSGLNQHLFRYFDYIGIDKLTFIKDYICHLQPFMISEIKSQESFENAICVLDDFYRISLYIKLDATKEAEIIVSFHENNKNGIAKRVPIPNRLSDVYVFADSVSSHVIGTGIYSINLFITRGVKSFPITIAAHKYDEEGFFVRYQDINNALISIVNEYLEDLYTSDLDLNSIELFSSLQQLSFTSYGNDIFSNLSLLIDSLVVQKDTVSKQIADAALCIYCSSIDLLEADKKELLETLSQRFSVNSIRIMPEILHRIETNLIS